MYSLAVLHKKKSIAALFNITKDRKKLKYLSTWQYTNKVCCIYRMRHYSKDTHTHTNMDELPTENSMFPILWRSKVSKTICGLRKYIYKLVVSIWHCGTGWKKREREISGWWK